MAVANPLSKAEAGRIGARRRWGAPRIVRLDDLTPPQRRLVLALVDAARNEKAPEEIQRPSEANAEGQANDRAAA